jgi:phage N-6-adenine-methyltransferase
MSGNDEWGTPVDLIESARLVLGRIELDPATHAAAQARVRADKFYTKSDNGLAADWSGRRVWCNPPYSRGNLAAFVTKMAAEVEHGMLLTHADSSPSWFQTAAEWAAATCFVAGRVAFLNAEGIPQTGNSRGSVLFYRGPNLSEFRREFINHGAIMLPAATK